MLPKGKVLLTIFTSLEWPDGSLSRALVNAFIIIIITIASLKSHNPVTAIHGDMYRPK